MIPVRKKSNKSSSHIKGTPDYVVTVLFKNNLMRFSESWDGPGRGEGSRRGRMTNGTPMARGRGGRGRGNSMGPRTFQNRQAPGFPDSIDTWGPLTDEKPNHQNNLKIGK